MARKIYINTVEASQEDLKALTKALDNKKDRITRIAFFQNSIRIYTV